MSFSWAADDTTPHMAKRGRTTWELWDCPTPMVLQLRFMDIRYIRLRAGDTIALTVPALLVGRLWTPSFLAEGPVTQRGRHDVHEYLVKLDCAFCSTVFWEQDDPEFLTYLADLQAFYAYREHLLDEMTE